MEKQNQTYYANMLGKSKSFISRVFSGERNLGSKLAVKVAKKTQTPVEIWLIGTEDNVNERRKIINASQSPKG